MPKLVFKIYICISGQHRWWVVSQPMSLIGFIYNKRKMYYMGEKCNGKQKIKEGRLTLYILCPLHVHFIHNQESEKLSDMHKTTQKWRRNFLCGVLFNSWSLACVRPIMPGTGMPLKQPRPLNLCLCSSSPGIPAFCCLCSSMTKFNTSQLSVHNANFPFVELRASLLWTPGVL